jgi:hypothetical protein
MVLAIRTGAGMTRRDFLASERSVAWWLRHLDIEVIESLLPMLLCSHCRAAWRPPTYPNGRWRYGWYRCPRRCK